MMLTEDQKTYLDKKIDFGIPTELKYTDRKSAMLHVLRAAEVRRNGVERHRQLYGSAVAQNTLDLTREALQHCINWISHEYTEPWQNANAVIPRTDENNIAYSLTLLQTASDYSELCDVATMLWLDKVEVKYHSDDDIELKFSEEQIEFEAAQWLWRLSKSEIPAPEIALRKFHQWLSSNSKTLESADFIFKIPFSILEELCEGMQVHSNARWELPGELDLDTFSITEFRSFTNALLTLAVIPRLVFNKINDVNLSTPAGNKYQWINLISKLANISVSKTTSIFDLLTYSTESTSKGKNRRKSEGISQPILQLDSDLFALSSMYVLISSSERNLFDLLSSKRPGLYDKIKEEKERQWAQDLSKIFSKMGLHAINQKKFQGPNLKGDIDLFVFDRVQKVGLIIQLKWLLMDRIKSRHLSDANICIEQSLKAIEWIKSNPERARDSLQLNNDEISDGIFLPLAVLREGLLNGFTLSNEVPLLNEQIFVSYANDCRNDLKKLWQMAFERRFLPIKNYHYYLIDHGYIPQKPFNGVRFRRPTIKPKELWEPWKDICI